MHGSLLEYGFKVVGIPFFNTKRRLNLMASEILKGVLWCVCIESPQILLKENKKTITKYTSLLILNWSKLLDVVQLSLKALTQTQVSAGLFPNQQVNSCPVLLEQVWLKASRSSR